MHYFGWIFLGFVALVVSNLIEGIGDFGSSPAERLPFYLTALALLLFALFSFFKGGRGAWRAVEAQFGNKPDDVREEMRAATRAARPASRKDPVVANAPQAPGGFDPDAALRNYMAKRDSGAVQPVEPKPAEPQPQRPVFGRKAV
ncbi:hypothetical protein [Erythrobacter sp. HKB08]|uniref:hypothetical protein n=1 Tax=Erythrobacter sp. HKB08 TaxID=2502843 RepID=UPI001008C394|nr:hypothetical protein [Erythrobacter sp. HKB08]